MLFWCPRREAGICGKPCFLQTVQHFLRFFQVPGGSKIYEKRVRKLHAAETGLQERLGRLLGAILEPFGCHFGSQNRSGRGSENEVDSRVVFKRSLGATRACGAGSPGLGPERRGGVGEGGKRLTK